MLASAPPSEGPGGCAHQLTAGRGSSCARGTTSRAGACGRPPSEGWSVDMRKWISALALVTMWVVAGPGVGPAAAAPPLPGRMAGIGDSITQAFDVCCWYGDHPAQSWSTGGGVFDGISSHYERIRAQNPAIYGRNYNDARSGARMRDAQAQAETAVAQQARYVAILMGANDVCTGSPATMTSVSDFR